MKKRTIITALFIGFLFQVKAQESYRYSVHLDSIQNDQLRVSVSTPPISEKKAIFAMPKIIPGTYAISDYGNFVYQVKAYNARGKELPVHQLDTNRWEISKANKLSKIVYTVEDIFDTQKKHAIYPMAATNFEAKNVVIHTPGVFGYLEGYTKDPFDITFTKPGNFYASSARAASSSTATRDVFHMENVDDLYDTPIMYGIADTATIQVGNCEVLVSVYSPNQLVHAPEIASWLSSLLQGARTYLGGKLPANRYAFLYYLKDPQVKQSFPLGMGGALEHTTSSFYYLPELPPAQLKNFIVDVSSHEFFHIITPLTIASKEVKEFNYDKPVLSKHLWLYEGSTEYTAHHVQVKTGLNTPEQFLEKLSKKMVNSKRDYKDSLSFTELSKYAASTYADQYGNVYEKGALIAACLDIYLLHLSDGGYSFRNLTHDLGIRYGKEHYFNDEELFDEIEKLSYPEIKQFLLNYVQGSTPIPYETYFGLAGIKLQNNQLMLDEQASGKALLVRKAWLGQLQ